MRKLLVGLAITFIASCASVSPEDKKISENIAKNGNQHVTAGAMLAMYYCENSAWPASLVELRNFDQKNKIKMPVQIDWEWLSRPGAFYKSGDSVELKTPEGNADLGDVAISSYHNPPACDGKNVEIKAHINLGA